MSKMKLPFLKSKPKEAAVKAPEKKAVAAPVKKPAPAAVPPVKNSNKNTLFTGLTMIVIAFVGVCVIFYFLNNSVQAQEAKIKNMIEDLAHLSEEKNILELEVQNLKAQGDDTGMGMVHRFFGLSQRDRECVSVLNIPYNTSKCPEVNAQALIRAYNFFNQGQYCKVKIAAYCLSGIIAAYAAGGVLTD